MRRAGDRPRPAAPPSGIPLIMLTCALQSVYNRVGSDGDPCEPPSFCLPPLTFLAGITRGGFFLPQTDDADHDCQCTVDACPDAADGFQPIHRFTSFHCLYYTTHMRGSQCFFSIFFAFILTFLFAYTEI